MTANGPAIQAARNATTTIPIVFFAGIDPVKVGLVASLNRPGGNLTGISNLGAELGPKRLKLLNQFIPNATAFAVLINPTFPGADAQTRAMEAAANTLSLQLQVLNASTEHDFDKLFLDLAGRRVGGLVIVTDPFFNNHQTQLGTLALGHAIPTIYHMHEFVAAGGLAGYGNSNTDLWRQIGTYAGRIVEGKKPADLPVMQPTKFELVINLKTAKALGITVPLPLQVAADEVIE